jgi:hypothetical protein
VHSLPIKCLWSARVIRGLLSYFDIHILLYVADFYLFVHVITSITYGGLIFHWRFVYVMSCKHTSTKSTSDSFCVIFLIWTDSSVFLFSYPAALVRCVFWCIYMLYVCTGFLVFMMYSFQQFWEIIYSMSIILQHSPFTSTKNSSVLIFFNTFDFSVFTHCVSVVFR